MLSASDSQHSHESGRARIESVFAKATDTRSLTLICSGSRLDHHTVRVSDPQPALAPKQLAAFEVNMGNIRDRVAASQPKGQSGSLVPKPSPRKLNIGVVGIGRMGQRHALNLLRLVPRATLVCACSPADADVEWAEEHLVPYGVAVFRTFEEMIGFPALQAVIIASATSLHYEHTFECLERGIHVICEKPVAGSLVEVSISGVSCQMMSNSSSWSA